MKKALKFVLDFLKREAVLAAALALAAVSAFIVPPDRQYIRYFDLRTLSLLFCLMAVMASMKEQSVFDTLASALLKRVKSFRSTVMILWGLCFFGSMLITNDVALITFVPFTIILLNMLGDEVKARFLIPVIAMQTIAANLGSMLTPIGNPQNLYLFGRSSMSIGKFILLMLPYTLISFVLLIVWNLLLCRKRQSIEGSAIPDAKKEYSKPKLTAGIVLFVLCLMTVARIIPYPAVLLITALYLIIFDRKLLKKIDYSLLITFSGFFIFIGNMGRIPQFCLFLEKIISGREIITAAVSSQFISNVPAALLLSGFTDNFEALLIGVNVGGLGTLIASMASLISFKYISKDGSCSKLRYLICFSAASVVFLTVLSGYIIAVG